MEYLCVVVDSKDGKTLAEYELTVSNEPFAKWKATKLFREANPGLDVDWTVDMLRLDC